MDTALLGEDRIDDAVISIPGDGVVRSNFGKDVDLDLSDAGRRSVRPATFPVRLLFAGAETVTWLFALADAHKASQFHAQVVQPAGTYNIPAIELDTSTSKAAVATVFEKVNTGGLSLNVFELLTATFAGDADYYKEHGYDFRLNDDWKETQLKFSSYPGPGGGREHGLPASGHDAHHACNGTVTTRRNGRRRSPPSVRTSSSCRSGLPGVARPAPGGVYLGVSVPRRPAHLRHPLPALPQAARAPGRDQGRARQGSRPHRRPREDRAVVLVRDPRSSSTAEPSRRGSSATSSRSPTGPAPNPARRAPTVQDASFVESRLHSLRTRSAAAYKGIYALCSGMAPATG